MTSIRHYINGNDFGEPRNWQDLEIVIDWVKKTESVSLNVTDLSFVLEANKYLQERIFNGLTGGVGVFEGEPYKIVIGDNQNPAYQFEGYLDLADENIIFGKEEIKLNLKRKHGDDWLNDVADSFSFSYLYNKGIITDADFVKVPYIINYIPDTMQVITLSLSLYMMTKELIENISKLAETIADIANASTPVVGVGVGVGAVVVTAWDLGDWVLVVLKALARIAYIIAITIAIVKLMTMIFEQLFPGLSHYKGMTYRRMFELACQHLGLTFQSSIPELDYVNLPKKTKGADKGVPTNDSSIYTFGDLIRVMKEMFNADYRIIDNVFVFERKDNFDDINNSTLPAYFQNQDRLLNEFSLNTDEIVSNYVIKFDYDVMDRNTLDNQDGRIFQVITEPVVIQNREYINIKGLTEIDIPFSLATAKKSFTDLEKFAKEVGVFVDTLTGIFGGGTNIVNNINNHIGSLLLSNHFTTSDKMIKMNGGKLAINQRDFINAKILWDKYHYINSFAEINGIHGQYFKVKNYKIPMSLDDFKLFLHKNKLTDSEGNIIFIDKLRYRPEERVAVIDYRINKKYTNNLKLRYV